METKVSFAIVGAFVLALSAAGIALVLWLGSGRISKKSYDTYDAYFTESVSGLNFHAPVRYHGVQLGSVQEISLDPADPQRVRLVLELERGTPVKEDTVATLRVQGLTGIAYVELGGGSRESAPLRAKPGERHPVIPTTPSLMNRLDTAATALLGNLDQTSQRINGLLDEETQVAFRRSVADLHTVAETLARRSGDVDAGMADAARTMKNAAAASAELSRLLARMGRGADAVERMASEFAQAGTAARLAFEGARGAMESASGGAQRLSGESVPELERLIGEMREATASLGRVARELERDPSALLQGRRQPPGPGE